MCFKFIVLCISLNGLINVWAVSNPTINHKEIISDHGQSINGFGKNNFYHTDNDETVEYTAAALQYQPFDDLSGGGLNVLQTNALAFVEHATVAKSMGAQIIVFPEYGLTSLSFHSKPSLFLSLSQVVPNPADDEVPCFYNDPQDHDKIMQLLSCKALEIDMYFVVNLVEQVNCTSSVIEDGDWNYELYNTQVVFDNTGAVVARYRKKHLFLEVELHPGTEPDTTAIFTTSFGVTFTLQICFDILYQDPAVNNINELGVKDVIMSTAWMDQLPFLTAPQIWKGFTEGNKVNLVVANIYNPSEGYLGAGIFRGYKSQRETYTYDIDSGSKLVIGKITTKKSPLPSSEYQRRFRATASMIPLELKFQKHEKFEHFQTNSVGESDILIVQKNPSNSENIIEINEVSMAHRFKHDNISGYSHSILDPSTSSSQVTKTLCHDDDLCCSVEYTYPIGDLEAIQYREESIYMLLAYSGVQTHSHVYDTYVQNCGVVLCFNGSVESCAQIEGKAQGDSALRVFSLSGTFKDRYIYPSIFTNNLTLIDPTAWNFNITEYDKYYDGTINVNLEFNDILSLALYSRWFSMDTDN